MGSANWDRDPIDNGESLHTYEWDWDRDWQKLIIPIWILIGIVVWRIEFIAGVAWFIFGYYGPMPVIALTLASMVKLGHWIGRAGAHQT